MIKPFIDRNQDVRIGGIAGKLKQHIDNTNVHLTNDEKILLQKLKSRQNSDGDVSTIIDDFQYQLNNKADKEEIPTKVSQLENDMNYLTEIPDYYTTEEEVKLLIQEFATTGDFDIDLDALQDQVDKLVQITNQYGVDIEQLKSLIEQNTQNITNVQNSLEEAITNITQQIENNTLKPATGTTLGGIKVGAGLDITEDGTLSTTSGSGGGDMDLSITDKRYLRKDTNDSTEHSLSVGKNLNVDGEITTNTKVISDNIESHNVVRGSLGSGYYLGIDNNNSILEIDDLLVRNKALFNELEIRKLSYVNGSLVLSAAGGTIQSVEILDNGDFKCYLKSDDGTTATTNTFQINDLVRCQTFDINQGVHQNVGNKFYWRQIVDSGSDNNINWVTLSKYQKSQDTSNNDQSGIPAEGDVIVQFGNTTTANRQNIIYLSSTDTNSPSLTMYTGVQTFDLSQATVSSLISPQAVKFRSDLFKLVSNDQEYQIAIDRGAWNMNSTYYYYDRVSHNGNLWLCIYQGEDGCTNIEPGVNSNSNTYWLLQVSKGETGNPENTPKLVIDQPLITTAFDGANYNPDITKNAITFHIETQSGDELPEDRIVSFYCNSSNENVVVQSATDSSKSINITECNLSIGESAIIKIVATINLSDIGEDTVIITNTATVLCIKQSVAEEAVQIYLNPQTSEKEYRINFDEDGLIKSIDVPSVRDNYIDVYVYKGIQLIKRTDISSFFKSVELTVDPYNAPGQSSKFNVVDIDTSPQPDYTKLYNIVYNEPAYTNTSIPEQLISSQYVQDKHWPVTKLNITVTVTDLNDNVVKSNGQIYFNIFEQSSLFENTLDQLTSVKTSVTTVEDKVQTNTSKIEQNSESISTLVSKVDENTENITTVTQKADGIDARVEAIEDDYITTSKLNIKAGEIISEVNSYTDEKLTKYSTIQQTDDKISSVVSEQNKKNEELSSRIDQISSGISMSVVYAGLKEAGIDIAVDSTGGTPTGTVNIYGDQVTIKNTQEGDNILWVSGNQAYIGNVNIDSGNIGGYSIQDSQLSSNDSTGIITINPTKIDLHSKVTNPWDGYRTQVTLNCDAQTYINSTSGVRVKAAEYVTVFGGTSVSADQWAGIFVDTGNSAGFIEYGIMSMLPISTKGIFNTGGCNQLVQNLNSGQTIQRDAGDTYMYLYTGTSDITVTLESIQNYSTLAGNIIEIYNISEKTVTLNTSGNGFLYCHTASAGTVLQKIEQKTATSYSIGGGEFAKLIYQLVPTKQGWYWVVFNSNKIIK